MLSGYAGISSLEVEQLDIKHQGGVGGDAAGDALGAVAHVRADGKLCSLAPGHLGNALVPASDDLASSQGEGEGLAPVSGAVHLGPVGQSKHVVTLHLLPGPGEAGTVPGLKSLDVNTHDVF